MDIIEEMLDEFYTRFESWLHIEPRCRSEDFSQGIEARTADPLWMLARQWQMGEFKGEDNGSPIQAEVSYFTNEIREIKLGEGNPIDLANAPPLEAIVEREAVEMDWRTRVLVGQQFERLLRSRFGSNADAVICKYRKKFPVKRSTGDEETELDRDTMRFLQLMEGRVIDGGVLLEKIRKDPIHLPHGGGIINIIMLKKALQEIVDWYDGLYTVPGEKEGSAWQPQRLEYKFKLPSIKIPFHSRYAGIIDLGEGIEAGKEVNKGSLLFNIHTGSEQHYHGAPFDGKILEIFVSNGDKVNKGDPVIMLIDSSDDVKDKISLVVPEYRNGELDWYHFVVENAPEQLIGDPITKDFTPACIEFPGMPVRRWWGFEDSNVDLGDLNVETIDLAKMALMDFVFVYGDDWFLVPLTVPMGSLTKINEICVTDVFGVKTTIKKRSRDRDGSPLDHWDMFTLSRADRPTEASCDDFLFIPHALHFREESQPVEEVDFMRDEGANRVWAVEHKVRNGLGNPVNGFDAQNERRECEMEGAIPESDAFSTGESLDNSTMPVYRLASTVPDNWIPYVPVHVPVQPDGSDLKDIDELFSIKLRQADMMSKDNDHDPMTSILNRGDIDWINEESIPRAGVKVQLTKQRVRWIDGKTYVWLGRKVVTGKGEGSSGLRFDIINYGSTKEKE
jgi:hypothetical protein